MTETGRRQRVRATIVVSGRVQGVGYRAFSQRQAVSRGLAGGVRNLESGQVELEVEGTKDMIEDLLQDLKRGPVGAHVTQVQVEWYPATDRFHDFHIWY